MMTRIFRIMAFLVFIAALVTACGGGGGGGGGGQDDPVVSAVTTTFSGGTLDALRAVNPSLTFDRLAITGTLKLPFYSSETITVNNLTITATGGIGYTYSTCEYKDAPSITINAAEDVTVEGEILLNGRSGTSVTSTATCNSCYGQDGGDITITAGGNITATGRIMNNGGGGATVRYVGYPSSACSAGGSGNLKLEAAENISVGSSIDNRAGSNFDGVKGTSGAAQITAGNLFAMESGSITTTGVLTFQTGTTGIWGPITYGTLNESIGGAPDTDLPAVTVLNPQADAAVPWNQPLQIRIQASDSGMGLREVSVKGFGHDQIHSASDFVDGVLTIDIPVADSPATLDVVASDNKGNQTSVSVPGLTFSYTQEAEPNDEITQGQTLNSGDIIAGDIQTGDPGDANAVIRSYLSSIGDPGADARLAEDWYVITLSPAASTLSVDLDFSGNSGTPDIDLYLMDGTGSTVLAVSLGDNPGTGIYTEHIDYSGTAGAKYYLVLQAYDVAARAAYRLTGSY